MPIGKSNLSMGGIWDPDNVHRDCQLFGPMNLLSPDMGDSINAL